MNTPVSAGNSSTTSCSSQAKFSSLVVATPAEVGETPVVIRWSTSSHTMSRASSASSKAVTPMGSNKNSTGVSRVAPAHAVNPLCKSDCSVAMRSGLQTDLASLSRMSRSESSKSQGNLEQKDEEEEQTLEFEEALSLRKWVPGMSVESLNQHEVTSKVSSAGMRPSPLEKLGSEIFDQSELFLDQAGVLSILDCNSSQLRPDLDDSEEFGCLEMSDNTFLVGCEPLFDVQLRNRVINIQADELIINRGTPQLGDDLDFEDDCEDLIPEAPATGALFASVHGQPEVGIAPASSAGFSVNESLGGKNVTFSPPPSSSSVYSSASQDASQDTPRTSSHTCPRGASSIASSAASSLASSRASRAAEEDYDGEEFDQMSDAGTESDDSGSIATPDRS